MKKKTFSKVIIIEGPIIWNQPVPKQDDFPKDMPEKLRDALPDVNELKKLLDSDEQI